MNGFLAVAAGGAIGAVLRHGVGLAAVRFLAGGGATGTLIVNIVGSAVMGLLMGWLLERDIPAENTLYLFAATGVLGGFTTFSSFSRETVHMINTGSPMKALIYALISVVVSITALMIALYLSRKAFG